MKVVTNKQMKVIDKKAINDLGIPAIVLMENAGLSVSEELEKDLEGLSNKNIVVFAGTGNNGGDAFVAARHMSNMGANVLVILVGKQSAVKDEALINLNILDNMGVNLVFVEDTSYNEEIESSLFLADAVVDGLLGTGLNKPVKKVMASVIDIINRTGKYVVSIDIPSGVDGDNGHIYGTCVIASKTITLEMPKLGILIGEGAKYTGAIEVKSIGIPEQVVNQVHIETELITKLEAQELLPVKTPFAHKGDNGKVLIIAGSKGLTGAAVLTACSAMRTGSGLVTLAIPESLNSVLEMKLTEVMTMPLPDTGGKLNKESISRLKEEINKFDVIAIGPGLGRSAEITAIVKWIVENSKAPLVIDSDGINSLEGNIDVLKKAKCPVVLTPHMGEMAKLAQTAIEEIHNDKMEILKKYIGYTGSIIVLKDWRTITAGPAGGFYINTTGNAGMATGGSGDVLTGMIASLIGQGAEVTEAAVLGVHLHGLAGDLAALKIGSMGMIAGDIVEQIPMAINSLIGG